MNAESDALVQRLEGDLRELLRSDPPADLALGIDDRIRRALGHATGSPDTSAVGPRRLGRPRSIALLVALVGAADSEARRGRSRLLIAALPAVAVVAVVIVAAVSVLRPSSAFATWSAVPTRLDPAFAQEMQDNCALQGPSLDDPNLDPEVRNELVEQQRIFGGLPLVVMDQRGRAAVALFAERRAEGQASVMCMTVAEEEGGHPVSGGGGSATGAIEHPADGPLRLFTAQRNSSEAGTYTAYAGHVDPEIVQVTIKRNEGGGVIASVANGYFLAWWPGDAYATSLVAYGEGGVVLAEIGNNGWDFQDAAPDPNPGVIESRGE